MNRLYLLSWYYQGQDGESDARGFFGKLREGIEKGNKFPFDCPSEVGLVHCKVDEHWCVGVLVMRGTEGDDSVEQTNRLHKWFEECDADFSGTDKTGERVSHPSVEGTLQSRYGSHYTCVEVFDPLSIVPGDKDRESESKRLPLENLNPEDRAIATDLISLGDDNPDARYEAYNVLDQKRYKDDVLLSGISRIEAEIPSNDVVTRVRLYCGLGVWLGGNRYTRPKGIELIRHAIELSTNMALPHALLGTLLMGDSSNLYLEQQNGPSREFPELSQKELELVSRDFHDQAQKELELAIRLNPNDPTPYYVFCKSQFLDFSQLKKQYLQGVQRDKTHSPEFGGNHWSFAIKAAKFNQASDATDAFLRAMIVSPQEYCEGTGSMRPKDGLALSCWQTAKQQIVSYRDNAGKIDALWLVEKSAPPSDTPAIPVSAPVNNYKAQFSDDEWTTLQCAIYWVFRQLFLIHRGGDVDKLTEAQNKAFGTVLQTVPIIKSALARQVLLSLTEERETFTKVWATCFMDPRHPADGLQAVSELVDGKLPTDISLEFKRTLLILGRCIHLEHEKLAGTNLPEKPGALSEPYQCLIVAGSSLRIPEKELMDDLFYTPMNIYDLPSATDGTAKLASMPRPAPAESQKLPIPLPTPSRDRAREARSPKSGRVLITIGALVAIAGGFFGLILLLSHRADPVLSKDPAATLTTMLLCPTPIVVIGLLMVAGGSLILRRAGQAPTINTPVGAPAVTPVDTAEVASLITDLTHYDEYKREAAAEALKKIGAPAVDPLLAALTNNKPDVRGRAASVLGEIKDPRAFGPLLAALKDADKEVRTQAAWALGRIGDVQAAEPLIAALKDSEHNVPWYAVAAALGQLGAMAVEPILTAIKDSDKNVRYAMVDALGKIGDVRAVEPLIASLKDSEKIVCEKAVESLGQIRDARAVEPLIAALKGADEGMRGKAMEALGTIGTVAVESLIAALKDGEWQIRHAAVTALGKIKDIRAVEPLIAALKDIHGTVRTGTALALGQIGDARAVEPLSVALKDSEVQVRIGAAIALGQIKDARAVEALITAISDSDGGVREKAAQALGQIGDARAVEPLIAALNDSEVYVRRLATYALAEIKDARAVEALITAISDSDGGVRRNAAIALGKIGDARAIEPLLVSLSDRDKFVRVEVAAVLGKIGDARVVKPLITALRDNDYNVREYVKSALVNIGFAAVEPLSTALKDNDEFVRKGAAEVIERIRKAKTS